MSKILLALAFMVLMIVVGPLAAIWALNTLFPALAIPVDFEHWMAAAVLLSLTKTSISKKD